MNSSRTDTLLVELGCEELPPKSLDRLAQAFFDGVCERLEKSGIAFDAPNSEALYSPRRLALRIAGVAASQPDREIERRGPAVQAAFDGAGAPTAAATGFARSVGLEVEAMDTLKTDKGEWLYCRLHEPGKPLGELLFPILQEALDALPVAKPMRWGGHAFSFVRPVHWLVVMHGGTVLPGELFSLAAGNASRGHRIHHPDEIVLAHADDYLAALERAHVLADPAMRRARIEAAVTTAGTDAGGVARITENLLDEVNNLVEWPVPVTCSFDEGFLAVPQEALIASMEDHQKFFPVLDPESGRLRARFIAVSNLESRDAMAVRQGFERVITPRLADARFFWEQDRKQPLDASRTALDRIVFQNKIGSIGDKSNRIAGISKKIAEHCGVEPGLAERAAQLCKCDLVSLMVGEFPELQGTMGGHYAVASGENTAVAQAIGEHYAPRFSGDALPESDTGQILALADRVDTLVGIFAAGQKPSGNKDPFALRRSALGAVRLLTETTLDLELDRLLAMAANELAAAIDVSPETLGEIRSFMLERARQYLREHRGFDTRLVDAALAAPLTTLRDLWRRVEALDAFSRTPAGEALVAANKRIGNILRKSEIEISGEIDADLLNIDEEKQVFAEVENLGDKLPRLFEAGDYAAALDLLAGLRDVVDAFFDGVMVMDEDLAVRGNRLSLLLRLKRLFDRVADLSLAG